MTIVRVIDDFNFTSASNHTRSMMTAMPQSQQIVIGVFYVLTVGIAFNLMVAGKVIKILYNFSRNTFKLRSWQMYNARKLVHTFIYILALSLVDAIILMNIPLIVTTLYRPSWPFSLTLCRLHLIADNVNKVLSTFILTAMSFDRYLIICHPGRFNFWQTKRVTVLVLSLLFAMASLLLYPYYTEAQLVSFRLQHKNSTILKCVYKQTMGPDDEKDSNMFVIFGVGYCLPLVLMSFFYCRIICQLYRVSRRLNRHQQQENVQRTAPSTDDGHCFDCHQPLQDYLQQRNGDRRNSSITNVRSSRNWAVTKRVSLLVVFYFVCWTPYWLVHFYANIMGIGLEQPVLLMLMLGAHILVYCNSAVNPLLYALLNNHLSRQVAFKAASAPQQTLHSQQKIDEICRTRKKIEKDECTISDLSNSRTIWLPNFHLISRSSLLNIFSPLKWHQKVESRIRRLDLDSGADDKGNKLGIELSCSIVDKNSNTSVHL